MTLTKTALLGAMLALASPALAASEDTAKTYFTGVTDLERIIVTSQGNDVRFHRDFAGKEFGISGVFLKAQQNYASPSYRVTFGDGRLFCTISDAAMLNAIAEWNTGDRFEIRGVIKTTVFGDLELIGCHFAPYTSSGPGGEIAQKKSGS